MPAPPHPYVLEPSLELTAVPPDCLPTLEAARVRLRWLADHDLGDLFALFADPEVTRYWPWPAFVVPAQAETLLADIRAGFTDRRLLQWGVARGDDDSLIGTCLLAAVDRVHRRAEIGFALARPVWGSGLMLEAVSRLIDFAFGPLGLTRLEADVDPRNLASLRLLERLGFHREGLLRERWRVAGELQDSLVLGLLARERLGPRIAAVGPREWRAGAGGRYGRPVEANHIVTRIARLPDEAPLLKRFIDELQAVEHAIEPDRRVDDTVADEYLAQLLKTVAEKDGRIFVAVVDETVVGWLVTHVVEDAIYVCAEDRTYGYMAELFVEAAFRQRRVAQALFTTAEADFAARGLRTVEINALAGNAVARAAYESLGYRLYSLALRKRL